MLMNVFAGPEKWSLLLACFCKIPSELILILLYLGAQCRQTMGDVKAGGFTRSSFVVCI